MTEQERDAVMQELANLRTVVADVLANRCVSHVLTEVALNGKIIALEAAAKEKVEAKAKK